MRIIAGMLVLTLVIPAGATAQAPDPILQPAARVRWAVEDTVDHATKETRFTVYEGRLDSVDTHSLLFGSGGSEASARASLKRMVYAETFTGLEQHTWEGGTAGLVVGATVGYLLASAGAPAGTECHVGLVTFCQSVPARERNSAAHAAGFGVAGAFAGAMLGHLIRTESWTPLEVGKLRRWLRVE